MATLWTWPTLTRGPSLYCPTPRSMGSWWVTTYGPTRRSGSSGTTPKQVVHVYQSDLQETSYSVSISTRQTMVSLVMIISLYMMLSYHCIKIIHSLCMTDHLICTWCSVTIILRQSILSVGLITSFAVHHSQCWLAVGTSSGTHICWDMRFQLPINSIVHPTGKFLHP